MQTFHFRAGDPIPVTVEHFPDLDLAAIYYSGRVLRDELREVYDQFYAKQIRSKVFTDLEDMQEIDLGFREIHWHAVRVQDLLRETGLKVVSSLYAPDPLSFGLARIYQQVVDPDGPLTIHVSDQRAQALSVLNLDEVPAVLARVRSAG